MKRSRGVTLIELVIVIAVMGVLAAVAIPSYHSYLKRSRMAEALQVLGSLRDAQKTYRDDPNLGNGSFATTLTALAWHLTDGSTAGKYYSYETDGITARAVARPGMEALVLGSTVVLKFSQGSLGQTDTFLFK